VIRLVGVELTRLRWRRAVLILVALGVALTAVVFVGVVVDSRSRTIEQVAADNGPQVLEEVARCVDHPRQYGQPKDAEDLQTRCEDTILGYYGVNELNLREQREAGSGPALVALLAVILLLAGTTFVGHDWNTGSMSNQLLFEPRRLRVWAAKAVAVTAVTGTLTVLVLAAYWTGLWAFASARGAPIGEHAVEAAYKQVVLGTAFVAGAALLGYALTMLLRTTVGSLGLLLGTAFLGIVVVWTGWGGAESLMPWTNFVAFVVGGYDYYTSGSCNGYDCESLTHHIGRADSSVYFAVVLLVVVAASMLSFRRRDVP